MDTSFWESLRLGFMQLRAECAINPPIATAGRLTAIWTAPPERGSWRLDYWDGKDGSGVAERFKWHSESAAARQGFSGKGDDAVSFWLDQIRRDAPESHVRRQLFHTGETDQLYSVEILDICGLSAEYCRKCEADETRTRGLAEVRPSGGSLRNLAARPIQKVQSSRHEIDMFANDAFATARDRLLKKHTKKERRVLGQVRQTHNSGGFLSALITLKADEVRDTILALADAQVEAFTLYRTPSDPYAEKALKTSAQQIAGGSISAVRGQLRLRSVRLRIAEEGRGVPWHLEIERSMRSALEEGLLRLKRQRIRFRNSGHSLQKAPPPLGRARAETALSKKRAAGGDSGKVKELGRSTSQVVKKKRGRPQTITDEKKAAALQLKKSGGTNKQVAALLYGTKYPTPQQTKNVSAILRHYTRKSKQSSSPVKPRKASPPPRKTRG
jgi:hypothetical protein